MAETFKTTHVRIMGEDYPIRSDADSAYIHELAEFVENTIRSVGDRKLPSRLKSEVLAAIIIADKYFTEKRKNADTEQRLIHLLSLVEKQSVKELI